MAKKEIGEGLPRLGTFCELLLLQATNNAGRKREEISPLGSALEKLKKACTHNDLRDGKKKKLA